MAKPLGKDFKEDRPGMWWNSRKKKAFFDVSVGPRGQQQRRRQTSNFDSIEYAREAFAEFRRETKRGATGDAETEQPDDTAITIAEYVRKYGDLIWSSCRTNTRRKYASLINTMVLPGVGAVPVAKFSAIHYDDFRAWCRRETGKDGCPKKVYSNYTINNAQRRIREILKNAYRRGVRSEDAPSFKKMEEVVLELQLSPEERAAFLNAFDDLEGFKRMLANTRFNASQSKLIDVERWSEDVRFGELSHGRNPDAANVLRDFKRFQSSKVWFVAALDTGLRKSDLMALSRRAVRFADNIIVTTMKKTGRSVTVPLAPTLTTYLRDSLKRGTDIQSTDAPVLVNLKGRPFSETTLKRYFAIAKWIAGIRRRFRFHDLRHTFGSDLGSSGFGENVIKDLLGHTTTAQTGRYVHPHVSVRDSIRTAIERRHDDDAEPDQRSG